MAVTFTKPGPTGAPKAPVKKAVARFGGIKAQAPRHPMPGEGKYIFRIDCLEEGELIQGKQSVRCELTVVQAADGAADREGDSRFIPFRVSGSGSDQGRARLKSLVIAATGCSTEAEYDALDTEGFLIDALFGYQVPNEFQHYVGRTLVGRLVACVVTLGNVVKVDGVDTGDRYREYEWCPVEETAQEVEFAR